MVNLRKYWKWNSLVTGAYLISNC